MQTMLAHSVADIAPMRFAEPADEEAIVGLLKRQYDEVELGTDKPRGAFSVEKVRATVQRATQPRRNAPDANQSWCGVVGPKGDAHALVYLAVQTAWDTDDKHLAEVWNYIVPEYRKAIDARILIAFSQGIAEALGLRLYGAVFACTSNPGRMRLYERQGCRAIGNFFVYDHAGNAPAGA